MGKSLYIAEKPSVAQEFARVLGIQGTKGKGFLESENAVVTWCVGHLVTMSYPEVYDPAMKKWTLERLPFLPEKLILVLICMNQILNAERIIFLQNTATMTFQNT